MQILNGIYYTRKQFPLLPGVGITIHKAQGHVLLQTIGDVPTRLLQRNRLPELHGGKKYKSTTLAVYVSSLQHFHSFLRQELQDLRGCLDDKTMEKISVVLKGCLTSLHKRRLEEML